MRSFLFKLFAILYVLTVPFRVYALGTASPADISTIKSETFEGLEELSKSHAENIMPSDTKGMAEFCQINGFRDRKESFAEGSFAATLGWQNSFYASFGTREASFLVYNYDASAEGLISSATHVTGQDRDNAWSKILADLKANTGPLKDGNALAAGADGMYADGGGRVNQEDDLKAGASQSSYICSDLTITNIKACVTGITLIQKIAKPVTDITMLPIWAEVGRDPVYINAFRKVSVEIAKNLHEHIIPHSTLFDDLEKAFLSETKNPEIAADYAWKTMALLATGGGNTSRRAYYVAGAPMPMLQSTLWILTMGSMALDRLTYTQGFLYTYPKEINNVCDYGKNYHFWMTAYLAREVMKASHDVDASAIASYSAQKGYQFAKQGDGRDPDNPFKQNLYSNYNNNMRLDLSLAAAGAWFGALSLEKNKTLNRDQVDKGINLTFDGSKPVPIPKEIQQNGFNLRNPMTTLSLYSDWKKIINPDAVFKYFQKEMVK